MDRFDMLLEPLRALLLQIGTFLPRLAIAVLVVIVGLLVAKAARFAVVRGLRCDHPAVEAREAVRHREPHRRVARIHAERSARGHRLPVLRQP